MQYYFEMNCNFYFETIYCTLHFFGRHLEWNGSKPPEPMTITLQALSLVEKAEPVQVRFTLFLRDHRSMWKQDDGCKVYMDFYVASMDDVSWSLGLFFRNRLLEAGLTQNWETMALRMFTTVDFILFYYVWGPAWIGIYWNLIWLRAWSDMTSHYTWGSVTTRHDFGGVLGRPLDAFLLGSHNFMVTALCSCVKWPVEQWMGEWTVDYWLSLKNWPVEVQGFKKSYQQFNRNVWNIHFEPEGLGQCSEIR